MQTINSIEIVKLTLEEAIGINMIVIDDSKQPWITHVEKFGFYFIHYLCRCCVCILYMLCVV